ncbi:MAG: sulfatase [Acidobacteriota bacterium]|nr:sulfatase [Acidobacteriota bacterium]
MTSLFSIRDPLRSPARWTLLIAAASMAACGDGRTPTGPASSMPVRPNVIVLLVDTLRADALGFGGCPRDTSPKLDRWARRGVVFRQATTPAGWTRPAVVSLFTGLYPAAHGVQDKDHVLPEQAMTLAEVFRAGGYRTQAFVTNFAVHPQFGTGQGFDTFRFFDKKVDSPPDVPGKLNYVPVGAIDDEVRRFLAADDPRPFFAYIHTTDPHYPYMPPVEDLLFGTRARGRYDGEVHYTDRILGGWLDLLEQRGLLERSIVVLTSDHGEEFHEHGFTGHGVTVFEECVRPLVLWAPGLAPGHRDALVSLTDLAPTLLEAAGLPAPRQFAPQGRSFWRLARNGDAAGGWSWAYSELVYPSKGITFAYREGPLKVLHIVEDKLNRRDASYLFDVRQDPFEQHDLGPARPDRLRRLREKMRAVRREHQTLALESERQPLDGEALDALRALGYVD